MLASLESKDARVCAAALTALVDADDKKVDLASIVGSHGDFGLREIAARALVARGENVDPFMTDNQPMTVRAEIIAGMNNIKLLPQLMSYLADRDPFLRHAAIQRLAKHPDWLMRIDFAKLADPKERPGLLLAWRASGKENEGIISACLTGSDPETRLLAARWISDEKLVRYRDEVIAELAKPTLDPRGFIALSTTLARLDNKPVNEDALAGYFLDRLKDAKTPLATRLMALRGIPANYKQLRTEQLTELLRNSDATFRVEALAL